MKMILFMMVLGALVGCQKSTKSSSSSSTTNTVAPTTEYCTTNPMGYGCPQYCAANPNVCSPSGTTTGTTTTGSTTGGSSQYQIVPPSDNNWTAMYPGGVPAPDVACPEPTGTGFGLRKGTITVAGGTWYSPDNAWSSVGNSQYTSIKYTHNNSSFFVDVNEAKEFLDSDAKLKIRLKVRPQPKPPTPTTAANGTKTYYTWCFNRQTGQSSNTYGYRKLAFSVSLRGVNANGTLGNLLSTQYVEAQVGGCSPTIDFSGVNQSPSAANGVVLVISDVTSDQGCWYSGGCTSMSTVKAGGCWSMDVEASVDGTKDI